MFKANFRTKVLVPAIGVMALLVAISMWLVNRRVREQIETGAAEQLKTAGAALDFTRRTRADDLLSRYQSAENEPRFKAAATMFDPGQGELDPEQRNTFLGLLKELINENVADFIVLTPAHGPPVRVARDAQMDWPSLDTNSSALVGQALNGQTAVDTVETGGRLFDSVSVPIFVENTNFIVGAVTYGVQNSMAQEFEQLTGSGLALLSGDRIAASTFRNEALDPLLADEFKRAIASTPGKAGSGEQIILGNEHYLCRAGWLGSPADPHRLGYLILSSYEEPLRVLQSTQRMILLISLLGVAAGAAIIWFLVNRVTQPLRELRDSAEAVGRGDSRGASRSGPGTSAGNWPWRSIK
jgi:hypothetical protein